MQLSVTPMDCSTPDFPVLHISQSLLNSYPLSWGYQPTISCSILFLPSVFPSIWVFSKELALCIRWPKNLSFSISPFSECAELISLGIDWFEFLKDWLIWFPCCPRNSQVSSPVSQLESINSSVLNLHYDPNLISIYDSWKNPNFD